MKHSTDIKILGGLPVTVKFEHFTDTGVGEWWIIYINDKKCKKSPQWLYNRIDNTKGEEERIIDKCNDSVTYWD